MILQKLPLPLPQHRRGASIGPGTSPPLTSPVTAAGRGKCACGGGCPRCKDKLPLQTKLSVNRPGDALEHEADRVARQVMRTSPAEQTKDAISPAAPAISRYPAESPSSGSSAVPDVVHEALGAPGRPLDADARGFFETRFGRDFGSVRVHTGDKASASARALNAAAYTAGSDIVFGHDQYAPATTEGRTLLAHELTHTVQQQGVGSPVLQRYGLTDGCSDKQQGQIHAAIDIACTWLDAAIPRLSESPLAEDTRKVLFTNFGLVDGVEANVPAILATLVNVRELINTVPIYCIPNLPGTICERDHASGWAVAGSGIINLCSDASVNPRSFPPYTAAVILHETLHASDPSISEYDSYSSLRGMSVAEIGYPGPMPLRNADAYTALVLDLALPKFWFFS